MASAWGTSWGTSWGNSWGAANPAPHPDRIYHVQHQARAVAVPDDARVHTIQQENRVTNITYDPEDES